MSDITQDDAVATRDDASTGARSRRSLLLLAVFVVTLLPLSVLAGAEHRSSIDLHATIEVLGGILALIAGLTFLVRFGVLSAVTHLLFGLAFLANGAIDIVHGLVPFLASRGWVAIPPDVVERVVPATFFTGRAMMVGLLLAAPLVRRASPDPAVRRGLTITTSVAVFLASTALAAVAFFIPVPDTVIVGRLVTRPGDLLLAAAFLVAAFVLDRSYGRTHDALTWWVALSAVLAAVGQFAIAVSDLHDPFFDLAHLYKALGYALPLLGLSLHHVRVIAERDRYAAALERSYEAQREFVSIASHELRTPLAGISGFGELLVEDWEDLEPEERDSYLAEIVRQSDRLTRLVNDLLALARLGQRGWPVRLREVDASLAAQRAAESCGSDEIEVSMPPGLTVKADPDQLERILLNLIDNGLKHGRPPVRVEGRRVDGRVELRVIDRGEGVPEEFRPRLFQPFAQAESGPSRPSDGAGLGLAIVDGLVSAHGGDIRYEEDRDGGATFVVTLEPAGS